MQSLKAGEVEHQPAFRTNCVVDKTISDNLVRMAAKRTLILNLEQVAMLRIPNRAEAFSCYAWMHSHFDCVGDNIPNSPGEIHLEPITIKEVWQEYCEDMDAVHVDALDVRSFASMWACCFSYVKIREFKAVTGKCDTCAALTHARRTFRDNKSRELVTYMHYLHRITYMGERKTYAQRVDEALKLPQFYMSIISDGMAQNHCSLPWFGNQKQFGSCLTQHLQGLLNHGRRFTFFRTFHNLVLGACAQLHCFLLELDFYYQRDGQLPDTLYYQVDGGIENVAKTVIVMMELLIAKRLTTKIVLTRLPVGHTHADIDAM